MVSSCPMVWAACLLLIQGVFGNTVSVLPLPRQVVKAGDPVTVICQISVAIDHCSVTLPNGVKAVLSPNKPPYEGVIAYPKEASMEKGQCGFTVERVDDKFNGNYSCWLSLKSGNREVSGNMSIIVAKAPKQPSMVIVPKASPNPYKENETFTATCTVENGRPAAVISWYIGEDRITSGLSQAEVQLTDPRLDLYTVQQNLTRSAQASDNNKALKCIASHPLLVNNITQTEILVQFAPKPLSGPVERFGLGEGEQRTIVVTVLANPRPTFYWTIGDLKIMENESDQSGKFHVGTGQMSEKVPGGWDTSLTIDNLKKEDVDGVNYVVTASNNYGEEKYTVIISTNPEPKVVDIGSGLIALIVIIVFVVLLTASIIIFARAKGRLCFAGKSGPQNTGECSDTESAEHHSSTKPKLLLPSVFKKKSDKVSADAPANQTKDVTVNDEKVDNNEDEDLARLKPKNEEGVVYAELDLQNSAPSRGLLVRPESDKTEYAEIIHTKESK